CAARLQQAGLQPGDRVVLLTPEKMPLLVAQLGTLYAGGVSLPLNPRFTAEELRYFLSDSGARIVIAGDQQRSVVESLRDGLPSLQSLVADHEVLTAASDGAYREPSIDADDPCLILYS